MCASPPPPPLRWPALLPWLLLAATTSLAAPPLPPPPPPLCPVFDSGEALGVPAELGSPVPVGRPRLVNAEARSLNVDLRFPCAFDDCPTAFFWQYKKENTTKWKDGPHNYMYFDVGFLIATTKLRNLDPNSKYIVRACPMARASSASQSVVPWCRTQNTTCFSENNLMTCEESPPPVENLTVHSAGAHWLALSWTPPAPSCETQLYYQVDVAPATLPPLRIEPPPPPLHVAAQAAFVAGRFASRAPQRPEGRVAPCAAWPGRHCLLLLVTAASPASPSQPLAPGRRYDVQIRVRREDDNISVERRVQGETRDNIASGAPEGLHCTAVSQRNLTARWLAPLKPGGRLTSAVVSYQPLNENAATITLTQPIVLRSNYSQRLTNLRPNTRYNLTVWFVTATADGRTVDGDRASVEMWTSPDCASEVTAARTGGDGRDGGGEMWIWLAALALTLVLLPIAFFLGSRSGRRKAVSNNGMTTGSCNQKLTLRLSVGAPASKPPPPADSTWALYDSVQPPCSTPPAAALVPPEYAEVRPPPAWRASDADHPYSEVVGESQSPRASYQSSHHYEILGAATLNPHCAASDSPYAEVLLPSNQQPPMVPSYLYAQVNKKKRQAPSPAPKSD